MEFEVRSVYTEADMVGFSRVVKVGSGPRVVFLLLLFSFLVMALTFGDSDVGDTVFRLVVITLFSGFILYRSSARCRGRVTWKQYRSKGEMMVISFGINGIHSKGPLSEGVDDYRLVVRVCEDVEHFYVFNDTNRAYILRKMDFTVGSPAQFGAFITWRTGKAVERRT